MSRVSTSWDFVRSHKHKLLLLVSAVVFINGQQGNELLADELVHPNFIIKS